MDIRSRINDALKAAMKAKEKTTLSTLRLINAAIKDRDIAMRGDGHEDGVDEADILGILAKMVRQRQESARAYEEGGRLELAEKELAEIEVIEGFLPRQLSDEETAAAIDEAITSTKATTIRDMGKVMAALKAEHTGQLDFARVGKLVKDKLA